jgi:MFS family permease
VSDSKKTQTTYHFERLRAVSTGISETAASTFLLLIAVRWYNADANYKAFIASASSFGYIAAPFLLTIVMHYRARVSKAASLCFILASIAYLLAASFPNLTVFTLSSVFAVLIVSITTPLQVQMYQENYPKSKRGRLFSHSVMIRIAVVVIFSEIAGRWLTWRLEYFPLLLLVYSFASAFSSYCLSNCETHALPHNGSKNPLRGLKYIKEDSVFRNTLICWMFMGFANLMMLPLRVEYLANPKYGMALSVSEIAFIVSVVPNLARFVMSPIWGALFDKVNFFLLRIVLNTGFAIGILSFFGSSSWTGLLFGAVAFGISNAGGDIAWSLWVTKFAPPNRVADYMAIHSFLTGLRGILAPFVAFHFVEKFTLFTLGCFAASLIFIASVLLIPEFLTERRKSKQKIALLPD